MAEGVKVKIYLMLNINRNFFNLTFNLKIKASGLKLLILSVLNLIVPAKKELALLVISLVAQIGSEVYKKN